MKIIQLSIHASIEKPAQFSTNEYECIETEKTYKAKGLRVNKTEVLRVTSLGGNYAPNYVSYYTWCLSEDIETARKMLIAKMNEKIGEFYKNTELLNKSFSSLMVDLAVDSFMSSKKQS